jgi:hypothetical protein
MASACRVFRGPKTCLYKLNFLLDYILPISRLRDIHSFTGAVDGTLLRINDRNWRIAKMANVDVAVRQEVMMRLARICTRS